MISGRKSVAASVGVLALQGECEAHARTLRLLGVVPRSVRAPEDLLGLTHLILPGGESTTHQHLLTLFGMWEPLIELQRAGRLALFGTCAGAILLARCDEHRPPTMELLDADVARNAYGRQVESFSRELPLAAFEREFHCVFIRAPRFLAVGPEVRVLARAGDEPILVQGRGALAATFHPELAGDPLIHRHFLEAVNPEPLRLVAETLESPHA